MNRLWLMIFGIVIANLVLAGHGWVQKHYGAEDIKDLFELLALLTPTLYMSNVLLSYAFFNKSQFSSLSGVATISASSYLVGAICFDVYDAGGINIYQITGLILAILGSYIVNSSTSREVIDKEPII